MARSRTPTARARIVGATDRNPARFRGRVEAVGTPLQGPSDFLDGHGKLAWIAFRRELPWLMESDRPMVEICAMTRGKLMAGAPVGATMLNIYQCVLSKVGASPTDRSKVVLPPAEAEPNEFFN